MSFAIDPKIVHHFAGGAYAKQMTLPKGYAATTHAHPYDHLSILSKGRAMVSYPDREEIYVAPACITIQAGVEHRITALDDSVWFCIHATQETDPRRVDDVILGRV